MVKTRPKNRTAHPAAPVMTRAAKTKAGIPSTAKPRAKRPVNDKLREIEARLSVMENPDDATAISRDPLVSSITLSYVLAHLTVTQFTMDDGSAEEDVDIDMPDMPDSEAPTEVDPEDYVVIGGKRIPLSSYNPRWVE